MGTLKLNLFCSGGGCLNADSELGRMWKEVVMASINPCHARQYRWVTPEILCSFCWNYKHLQKNHTKFDHRGVKNSLHSSRDCSFCVCIYMCVYIYIYIHARTHALAHTCVCVRRCFLVKFFIKNIFSCLYIKEYKFLVWDTFTDTEFSKREFKCYWFYYTNFWTSAQVIL